MLALHCGQGHIIWFAFKTTDSESEVNLKATDQYGQISAFYGNPRLVTIAILIVSFYMYTEFPELVNTYEGMHF